MVELRTCQPDDLKHFYEISIATGHAGGDASSMYKDARLIGHIYSAPYALLEPRLALVAVDSDGVAGFIVGVDDTTAWEDRLETEWWPGLRKRYVRPDDKQRLEWTPDQRRIAMIFDPERTPLHIIQSHPAHLHLNILPRLQRQGVGSRLLDAWIKSAAKRGVGTLHVGVNCANINAIQFWSKRGFAEIPSENRNGRTIWMGRPTTT